MSLTLPVTNLIVFRCRSLDSRQQADSYLCRRIRTVSSTALASLSSHSHLSHSSEFLRSLITGLKYHACKVRDILASPIGNCLYHHYHQIMPSLPSYGWLLSLSVPKGFHRLSLATLIRMRTPSILNHSRCPPLDAASHVKIFSSATIALLSSYYGSCERV